MQNNDNKEQFINDWENEDQFSFAKQNNLIHNLISDESNSEIDNLYHANIKENIQSDRKLNFQNNISRFNQKNSRLN